jgi:type 1 fimbria pilin
MKKYFTALSATALISLAPYALASSTDLTVTGTITPAACMPNLSVTDIDLGRVVKSRLHPTNHTRLGIFPTQLTVSCDAPTRFALRTVDAINPGTGSVPGWFGLGLTPAGEKLGTINVRASTAQADGVAARAIVSEDDGATWTAASWVYPDRLLSTSSTADTSTPIEVKDLVTELDIYVNINRANSLTLNDDVPFNGAVTFELTYL